MRLLCNRMLESNRHNAMSGILLIVASVLTGPCAEGPTEVDVRIVNCWSVLAWRAGLAQCFPLVSHDLGVSEKKKAPLGACRAAL